MSLKSYTIMLTGIYCTILLSKVILRMDMHFGNAVFQVFFSKWMYDILEWNPSFIFHPMTCSIFTLCEFAYVWVVQ